MTTIEAVEKTNNSVTIPKSLRWRPLPAPLDVSSSPLPTKLVKVQAQGQNPCRRCLKDGKFGEEMLLISYDPFLGDSPYRKSSPIFVHIDPFCKLADFALGGEVVPEQQRSRQLSIQAYDHNHMLVDFDVIQGVDLVDRAERFMINNKVEYLHVHYAGPGCFAVKIEKGQESL